MSFANTTNPAAAQAPAAATAAVATLTGETGKKWTLNGVAWSYSAAPTGGSLTIAWTGGFSMVFYITAAGPGQLPFYPPIIFPDGATVTITLASGAGAVVGTVYPQAEQTS